MSVTIDGPADLSALYRSADRESQRAQRTYLRSLRVRLGALLVAAFGGAIALTTAGGLQVGGGLAFVAFACALGAELFLATTSPLTTWYEGRAAAESAKTLAWRYMVRAEPFEVDGPDVDKQFVAQTYSLLQDLRSISSRASRIRCRPDQREDAPSPGSRSLSTSVGRSISRTGLPTSNAGIPRRRGGMIAERADGCS